jgi:hypothetical protein
MSDTDELHEDRPWEGEWWPAAQMLHCDPTAEAVTAAISTLLDEKARLLASKQKTIAALSEAAATWERLANQYRAERDTAYDRQLRSQ